MKDKCVSCHEFMPYQKIERYDNVGNYCGDCLTKVNINLKQRPQKEETLYSVFNPIQEREEVLE